MSLGSTVTQYSLYNNPQNWINATNGDLGDLNLTPSGPIYFPPSCWESNTQCYGDGSGASGVPDGVVDNFDWVLFRDGYLTSYADADNTEYMTNVCGDNTRDGEIDNFDWITFRDNYLKGAVPTDCSTTATWPPG